MVVLVRVERPVRYDDVRLDLLEPGGYRLQCGLVGRQLLMRVVEEMRFGPQDLAGGRRLTPADDGFRFVADFAVTSKTSGVGNDHFMACSRQESDQAPAAGLRVVGMRAKDDHAELASLCLPPLAARLGNQFMCLDDDQFLSLRSPGGTATDDRE